MYLFKTYNKTFIFKTNKPKDEVRNKIIRQIKKSSFDEDTIEVIFKPSLFNPFEANGSIRLNITSTNGATEIICSLTSKYSSSKSAYILFILLCIWTLVALITSFSVNYLLMIAIGWTGMLTTFLFVKKLNEGKLENHLFYIIREIK